MSKVTSITSKKDHVEPGKPANEDNAQPKGAMDWSHLHSGSPVGLYDRASNDGRLPRPEDVNPDTIRGSVLTTEGWLCSEPHHTKHISNEAHLVAVPEKA